MHTIKKGTTQVTLMEIVRVIILQCGPDMSTRTFQRKTITITRREGIAVDHANSLHTLPLIGGDIKCLKR